ncbi:ureidoglycolate hydrolase [Sphaerochaeta pleomorpha str. Grapes]|uniref:Ureidoglycolate hydrolase n=1 Tax=Sphaerochaeta pleomorpha (strain ATCC BAA-1885 / DSM 22778 / Grapes) TaxID=158190 RepID=G8QU75_SPHPG|nr:ureidoglycolate lyase [Sphaerochaeta pleomorpha]AEV28045.1 ureidoglycolate hydrolase [Sphaerochaeta pleomorpha str. Grapes]
MKTIKAKQLSKEAFNEYGSFYNLLEPRGHNLGTFYHDHVLFPVAGNKVVGFSALVCAKGEKMVISAAEYHNTTGEMILSLDGDVIVHVAPPSTKPVPELTEAFYVPAGTLVKLNAGVWHLAPFAVNTEVTHLMIALPERTYMNDCVVVEYPLEDQIEVIL